MNNAVSLAKELGAILSSIPGLISELFTQGKNFIYNQISESLQKWADKDAFNQGKDTGIILGQIIFEIIIAVIGNKGVDKLAKAAKTGKLATVLKSAKLEKVIEAIEKLVELKNRLFLLLKGAKYDDVIKLLSACKKQIVQKVVQEVLQEVTEKGLKEVSEKLTEKAIKKIVEDSLEEIGKETGKKISKKFVEETTETIVREMKDEVIDTSKKKLVKEIVETQTKSIDTYLKSPEFLRKKIAAFKRYKGDKSFDEWEKIYDS